MGCEKRNPEFKDKLELLKLVSQFAENESDRGAARHRSFLLVNTGFVGALSLAPESILAISGLLVSLLGILTSFVWLQTVPKSHFYERRWIDDQKKLIDSDDWLKEFVGGRHRSSSEQWDEFHHVWWSGSQFILLSEPPFILWDGRGMKNQDEPEQRRKSRSFRELDYWQPMAFTLFWVFVFFLSIGSISGT